MACAAIMQRKWRCRVGTARRMVAEKLDVTFDLGWSSASALQQLHYFESGFSRLGRSLLFWNEFFRSH